MPCYYFFFFNDTATTEIYTLSLHDALPIFRGHGRERNDGQRPAAAVLARSAERRRRRGRRCGRARRRDLGDRKSTRLNSSHSQISYAVFCLKKKNNDEVPLVCLGGGARCRS